MRWLKAARCWLQIRVFDASGVQHYLPWFMMYKYVITITRGTKILKLIKIGYLELGILFYSLKMIFRISCFNPSTFILMKWFYVSGWTTSMELFSCDSTSNYLKMNTGNDWIKSCKMGLVWLFGWIFLKCYFTFFFSITTIKQIQNPSEHSCSSTSKLKVNEKSEFDLFFKATD